MATNISSNMGSFPNTQSVDSSYLRRSSAGPYVNAWKLKGVPLSGTTTASVVANLTVAKDGYAWQLTVPTLTAAANVVSQTIKLNLGFNYALFPGKHLIVANISGDGNFGNPSCGRLVTAFEVAVPGGPATAVLLSRYNEQNGTPSANVMLACTITVKIIRDGGA
jgi:hypothetical protein